MDGLLNDRAGIIAEASEIATGFNQAEDKAALLAKLRQIPGAAMYVFIATRIVLRGASEVENNRAEMLAALAAKTGTWATKDSFKRQINVIGEFLPIVEEEETL
jgi:hypothetical protein